VIANGSRPVRASSIAIGSRNPTLRGRRARQGKECKAEGRNRRTDDQRQPGANAIEQRRLGDAVNGYPQVGGRARSAPLQRGSVEAFVLI
jgi:hypothetical protein